MLAYFLAPQSPALTKATAEPGKRSTRPRRELVVETTTLSARRRPASAGIALMLGILLAVLSGIASALPAHAASNDYPAQWREPNAADSVVDDWGYWNRECTSFVAWRLHGRNGFEMPRAIGDAGQWRDWAVDNNYAVDSTAAAGAVAWWSGHVAWVESVNGTNVTIEEYNFDTGSGTHLYNTRTIAASTVTKFIHFKDILTQPLNDTDGDGVLNASDTCPTDHGYFSWNWWTGCPVGRYDTPYQVSGDFNGDGKADVAVLARAGAPGTNLWVFPGSASGLGSPVFRWQSSTWYWEGEKVLAGNFNGDQYGDLAVLYKTGSASASLSFFYGSAVGLTSPTQVWADTWAWQNLKPLAGDFNNDGKTDVGLLASCGSTCSNLWVLNGTANGVAAPTIGWSGAWAWTNLKPFSGDFNGDGKSEVAMLTRCGTACANLYTFNGASNPTFVWNGAWTWENLKPFSGDFNGDGKADVGILARATPNSNLWVFNGSATGVSASPTVTWSDAWTWENLKPFSGDFNGDGKADVGMLARCGAACSNLWVFNGSSSPAMAWNDSWAWQNLLFS